MNILRKQYDDKRLKDIKTIDNMIGLAGKKILDLGCGEDAFMLQRIADEYKDSYIYGIDPFVEAEVGENFSISVGDARNLEFDDNTFDVVYSMSTFEHINGTQKALSEIKRVLKPYGKVYISFAPLWTSVCGHHCYNMMNAFTDEGLKNGDISDERITYAIPPWGHLYMSEEEMVAHLHKVGFQENKIKILVNDIYHHPFINRERAFDIRSNIINSGMIIRQYLENVTFSREWSLNRKGESELTASIAAKIISAGYTPEETGVVFMQAILEKCNSVLF